jgi:predicted metal-dependent HD superfamily phosphohydrolase
MTGDADRKDFAALLAHIPVDGSAKSELSAMMAQLDRFYHGKAHLAQLWRRHRRFAAAEGLSAPGIETLIACAIAYHDCVYDGRRHDNEERSAETWMRASADTSLSEEDRRWVAETSWRRAIISAIAEARTGQAQATTKMGLPQACGSGREFGCWTSI